MSKLANDAFRPEADVVSISMIKILDLLLKKLTKMVRAMNKYSFNNNTKSRCRDCSSLRVEF